MNTSFSVFARELRRLRQRSGLSLRELAERSAFSVAYLSLLENDKRPPSPQAVKRLAACLLSAGSDGPSLFRAAGYDPPSAETPSEAVGPVQPFLHLLLNVYATFVQAGPGPAQQMITSSLTAYPHPLCLQLLVVFLEAVQGQSHLARQAFAAGRQAFSLQPEAFPVETLVYAEILLLLYELPQQAILKQADTLLATLAASPEKDLLAVFWQTALTPPDPVVLAVTGERLLCTPVVNSLLPQKRQAILRWLKALVAFPAYHAQVQRSLSALQLFAEPAPELLQIQKQLNAGRV